MTLIKWNNKKELESPVRNFMDRFFGGGISDFVGNFTGTVPSVNIQETKNEVRLDVAVPGMSKDDFKVTLENDYLTVSGEKQNEVESEDENYNRKEFSYESFQRSFYLPENMVMADKIDARYTDGILHLTIPKSEEAKAKEPKGIEIS